MYVYIIICLILLLICNFKKNEYFSNNNSYIISIFLTENHCLETKNLLKTLEFNNLLDKVVITCLDNKCYDFMKELNININIKLYKKFVSKEANYHTFEFRKMFINKLKIISNLLKQYKKPILHIDTDIVVLSSQLDKQINDLCHTKFDIIFQSDNTNFIQSTNLCTGFMLLNYTKNTLFCLKKGIYYIKKNINQIEHWGDQRSINYVLKKYPNKFIIKTFSHIDYPNGYRYFNNLNTVYKIYKPIIVHNNYIKGLQNKINRFKKHKLWFIEKKVAICFFGLTRSLKSNYNNLKKYIFDILSKNGYQYDIFIHTYNKNTTHNNPRAYEYNVTLDNEEYKILNPTKFLSDDEEIIDNKLNYDIFKKHGDPWNNNYSSFHNFIKQLNSLKQVTSLWENDKDIYDSVIYIRPDTLITKPLEIHLINNFETNTIYVPNFHSSGGYNDRFAFGCPNAMIHYGNRFDHGLLYSQFKIFHAETFLKYIIQRNKINVIYTDMVVCRKRGNNVISHKDFNLLSFQDQINYM
jgi:hypothetical protein